MAISVKQSQKIKGRARSFHALMSLYEENYVRFNQLVSGLPDAGRQSLSQRTNDVDLYLQILERYKYTTTVLLTYRLQCEKGEVSTPDMKIRLYHDARQAEVMSCCCRDSRHYGWLERDSCHSVIEWRWRMNHFLFKWLNYCLKSGHGFPQQKPDIDWSYFIQSVSAD